MKHLRHIAALLMCLVLVFCLSATAFADESGYYIEDYSVNTVLHKDNSVSVTEVIRVNFYEARHGIYRTIPKTMSVGARIIGETGHMQYKNRIKDVRVEGAKYSKDGSEEELSIKIGDKKKTVYGPQEYTISYTYIMPDDRMEQLDFIFYSFLGPDWGTDIEHFSFSMSFDKPLPKSALDKIRFFSGSYGLELNELEVSCDASANELHGEAFNIQPYQAITLFTVLPQGYFEGAYAVSPIPGTIFAVLTILLGAACIAVQLFRKRGHAVETVEFYPPDDMCSAEVGVIIDNHADERDLISLIIWWAHKGYITITENHSEGGLLVKKDKVSVTLNKVMSLPNNSPAYQTKLFKAFFPGRRTSVELDSLGTSFGEKFSSALKELENYHSGDRTLYEGEEMAYWAVILLSVLVGMMAAMSGALSLFDCWPFGLFIAAALMFCGVKRLLDYGKRPGCLSVILYIAAIAAALLFMLTSVEEDCILNPLLMGIAYAVSLAAVLLAPRFLVPTGYKLRYIGRLKGLRRFIKTAELSRLKLLVDENPHYFYDILPYAIAFGLVDEWAKRFESITLTQPSWYSGNDAALWNARLFSQNIERSVSEPISSAYSAAEAASSSSSGGYSGGGGGGGGGGSW